MSKVVVPLAKGFEEIEAVMLRSIPSQAMRSIWLYFQVDGMALMHLQMMPTFKGYYRRCCDGG